VKNSKKFEEGIFSDLRNLKSGTDASLEEPKSGFLDFLYKNNCIRTQKKQKVFYWYSVPHDKLFLDALERDLKREKMGQEATTVAVNEPALSFEFDSSQSLFEQLTKAQTDFDAAKESLDAAKKLLDNRQQLLREGALARKLVDGAWAGYAALLPESAALIELNRRELKAVPVANAALQETSLNLICRLGRTLPAAPAALLPLLESGMRLWARKNRGTTESA